MAGVRKLIVSLWEVNDQAAVSFMIAFYNQWLAGVDISEAFYQAKLEARRRNADPYFWAPFVLIE
jgi:CHAT domain-containing protein